MDPPKLTPVVGTLNGEPIPFNSVKSLNSLYRGQVQLHDGTVKSCLLKNINRIEIVNELVANLVACRMGLPTPLAVLTFVPDSFNNKNQFSKSHKVSGGYLAFASVDAQTPNLLQRLEATHPLGRAIIQTSLSGWSKKSELYGFDTWVANVDRHIGNILFGSNNEIWLIDHGRCFTKEDWSPSDLDPNVQYLNKLKLWYTLFLDSSSRQKTANELRNVQAEVAKLDIVSLMTDSLASQIIDTAEQAALQAFLTARIGRVASDGAAALQP